MKYSILIPAILFSFTACGTQQPKGDSSKLKEAPVAEGKFYSFSMTDIDGNPRKLSDYKGKVLLVVNVASKCGNTPQYKGLEAFYEKHRADGFEILGFPANNFGSQEPGTESEIKEFCTKNYGVTFPMFSKLSVKGADKHSLFKYLTEETAFKGEIGWNFAKFLVDREGKVVGRFDPGAQIESAEVKGAILSLLK